MSVPKIRTASETSRLEESQSIYCELIHILSWGSGEEVLEALEKQYVERISSALALAIGKLEATKRLGGRKIYSLIDRLENEAFLRILIAPEMCSALASMAGQSIEEFASFLRRAIQAEESRMNDSLGSGIPTWTALGDCYISEHPPSPFESLLTQIGNYCFEAPHLDGVPVDLGCPTKPSYPNVSFREPAELNAIELTQTLSRMRGAMEGIRNVSSCASFLTRRFTRGFVFRKDLVRREEFWNGSSNGAIGRTVFVNPQIEAADGVELAEAAVHEAIHSLLYTVELAKPFSRNHEAIVDIRIPSPWTGSNLNVPAYLHGCLVWFGLWQFWRRAVESTVFPSARAQERENATRLGFLGKSLTEPLLPIQDSLQNEIIEVINGVQALVLRECE